VCFTFPTAASPRRTSLTLLLGLGALGAGESDIAVFVLWVVMGVGVALGLLVVGALGRRRR
jgi:hypothetical protein